MTITYENSATWREIHRQSQIWRDWGRNLDLSKLRNWLAKHDHDQIWLCGAGTSAYIGDIIAAQIPSIRSVPSTDLVANPTLIKTAKNPLVVSFGRSGNSAETIGTLDVLDTLAPNAPRLNITCNQNSVLAQRKAPGPTYTLILPDETHDEGFAMTSSFSTMLLTALAAFDQACDLSERLEILANQLEILLPLYANNPLPARAVFVGTGPLAFAAREAALKVMELSAGQIPALWDSSLGFRHGPKSFVTDGTAITIFRSSDAPANAYENDLASELKSQFPMARTEVIGPRGDIDFEVPFGPAWAAPLYVACAQIRGVQWSACLGLNVDDPFVGESTLTRVVSNVKIYPVTA